MPKYRIERTEISTRVFEVEAKDEDEALESYIDSEPASERHTGQPDVRIEKIKATKTPRPAR